MPHVFDPQSHRQEGSGCSRSRSAGVHQALSAEDVASFGIHAEERHLCMAPAARWKHHCAGESRPGDGVLACFSVSNNPRCRCRARPARFFPAPRCASGCRRPGSGTFRSQVPHRRLRPLAAMAGGVDRRTVLTRRQPRADGSRFSPLSRQASVARDRLAFILTRISDGSQRLEPTHPH